MSKHTPGPWKYIERTHEDEKSEMAYLVCAVESADGSTVLSCEMGTKPADARLIAAAPEMLEALKVVANDDGCPPEIAEVVLKAIAKAEGK